MVLEEWIGIFVSSGTIGRLCLQAMAVYGNERIRKAVIPVLQDNGWDKVKFVVLECDGFGNVLFNSLVPYSVFDEAPLPMAILLEKSTGMPRTVTSTLYSRAFRRPLMLRGAFVEPLADWFFEAYAKDWSACLKEAAAMALQLQCPEKDRERLQRAARDLSCSSESYLFGTTPHACSTMLSSLVPASSSFFNFPNFSSDGQLLAPSFLDSFFEDLKGRMFSNEVHPERLYAVGGTFQLSDLIGIPYQELMSCSKRGTLLLAPSFRHLFDKTFPDLLKMCPNKDEADFGFPDLLAMVKVQGHMSTDQMLEVLSDYPGQLDRSARTMFGYNFLMVLAARHGRLGG